VYRTLVEMRVSLLKLSPRRARKRRAVKAEP
jgi:hypothetical protein